MISVTGLHEMKEFTRLRAHELQFFRGQFSNLSLKANNRDRLDLLKMERAVSKEPLGNRYLPAVIAHGCRMGNDKD